MLSNYTTSIRLVSVTCFSSILCCFQQPSYCDEKVLLKGTIVLDEFLSPMPDALMPGKGFDKSFSQSGVNAGDKWYQVPSWMSGKWHHRGKQTLTNTNLATGEKRHQEIEIESGQHGSYGRVKDKNDVIWDRAPIGEWLSWQYKGGPLQQSMALSGQTKLLDNGDFVVKSIDLEVAIDPASGKILSTQQSESINTYTRNPDSSITVHSTSRFYDRAGRATFDQVSDVVMAKIEDIDFTSQRYLQARREFFLYWLNHSGYGDQ